MLSTTELRKARNKEAIKQAALDIASKEGWSAVTIRKIADEILYTPPIVYEHFKNKDDLFQHLVKDGFKELSEKTFAAMEKVDTPDEKILALARVRFDFALKNETLHHMMFDADNPDWQRLEMLKAMGQLKNYVFDLMGEISGKPDRAPEYFLNMICLVKGYTYFHNKMGLAKKLKIRFFEEPIVMKDLFIDAIDRFLISIKES